MGILLTRLCLSVLLVASCAAQNLKQDGKWWRDLSDGERVEFLAGFIDCYANDLGDKNNTFPESWYTYAPRISSYYQSHPQQLSHSVTQVLFKVRSVHPPKPPKDGEVWRGKHWFFDGEYWGQIGKNEQVAFIDGYLTCYREYLASRTEKFSKSSNTYANGITGWFDAEPTRSPKLVTQREKVAIADVLYKVR